MSDVSDDIPIRVRPFRKDPTAEQAGVPTLHAFFNWSTAKSLERTFNVVNASGVFFHLEELHSAAAGTRQRPGADVP